MFWREIVVWSSMDEKSILCHNDISQQCSQFLIEPPKPLKLQIFTLNLKSLFSNTKTSWLDCRHFTPSNQIKGCNLSITVPQKFCVFCLFYALPLMENGTTWYRWVINLVLLIITNLCPRKDTSSSRKFYICSHLWRSAISLCSYESYNVLTKTKKEEKREKGKREKEKEKENQINFFYESTPN